MLDSVCRRAFFQFEVPIYYRAPEPRIDGDASKWSGRYLLPALVELEDRQPQAGGHTGTARIIVACWNA